MSTQPSSLDMLPRDEVHILTSSWQIPNKYRESWDAAYIRLFYSGIFLARLCGRDGRFFKDRGYHYRVVLLSSVERIRHSHTVGISFRRVSNSDPATWYAIVRVWQGTPELNSKRRNSDER